ncbi:MAG: hypothetical protein E3J86_11730 [Candidatus Thorarchaeota archaeon]|nr:MAG: hypothetical protein E3J86_11730 [Candidatus Thorarchaeota archaeon]
MVDFREFDELEDDEEDLRMRMREHHLTEEERDQFIREFNAEYFGKQDITEASFRLSNQEAQENKIPRYWEIRSNETLNETLNKYWKIITTPNFNKRYRQAEIYCSLLEALDNQIIQQTPKTYREFAASHGIHRTTVTHWATGEKKPSLINQLEYLRKSNSPNTNNNESAELSIFDGKKSPHVIFSTANNPLTIVDRKSFGESGYLFRPGIVGDRNYLWIQEKDSLLSAFGKQYFYFKRMQDLERIFEEAASQLELGTMVEAVHHIYQLSKQFTEIEREFIAKDNPRISGSSLHLLCDIAGIPIIQLEGRIVKICGANGQGGIKNPRFPVADELEVLKARMIGIAVSDCHLPKSGSLELFEGSLDRIDRVKKLLDNFGVTFSTDSLVKRKGDYAFYIASPMLGALEYWGIPTGDRTILNYGLPDEFQHWSTFAKCGYMQEMLAQEGHVDKNGVIRWPRSHALFDGNKGPRMGFKSRISQDVLKFLRHSREMHKHRGIVTEQSIAVGRLDLLKESTDIHLSSIANELSNVIWNYRNRLIDDETKIAESLGINISLKPVRISYFEKSDRVSVKWQARVKGYKSKIKSALIIRPNFDTKETVLSEWLAKQNVGDFKQTKMKLKSDGYPITE